MANVNTNLSTEGIEIKINNVAMEAAYDFSQIGGEPSQIDTTTLKDKVRTHILGVQEQDNWTVNYYYKSGDADNDYKRLRALQDAKTKAVPVEISFPDGMRFTNSGEISTYIQGKGVNEAIAAVAVVALDDEWTPVYPTGA